jgi:hypothetical protein
VGPQPAGGAPLVAGDYQAVLQVLVHDGLIAVRVADTRLAVNSPAS